MISRLHFINEAIIPQPIWENAEKMVEDMDINDVDFVALSIYLKAGLWTGDKVLYNGLKTKSFRKVYNTHDLALLRKRLIK